ncbi:transposable element Tcb1 transposase [Trichonephila clavipes]|nr:transposable element Tcb1 transposase [Trichonephila clavipes]
MFPDETRISKQFNSRLNFIWREEGTSFRQKNIIEQHHLGGAGFLVFFFGRGDNLDSRTNLHVQIGTMSGQVHRDSIVEQHVSLLRDTMGAEFVFMDGNVRPPRANIVNECLQSEDITLMD